ncbi:MAG: 1-acyl-sn-glycerol-3-phosphate acyltransferase [Cyclobacteriaceae bacterium]|nr:1-acyl-sn-glycerol-3-phosphate acyltransferase [Cyclobacteriaceae bacterium]
MVALKENFPDSGPVIIAANHQNSFLDAILIASSLKRKLNYLGRADVFRNKIADKLLRSIGLMPIYRFRDGFGDIKKNNQVFENCKELLNQAEVILIFPEGNHSMKWHLRPLQKGLARIAQIYLEQKEEVAPLTIVPCGLQFDRHNAFSSRVLINFGTSFQLKKTDAQVDHRIFLNNTMQKINHHLSPLILNIPEENYFLNTEKWLQNRKIYDDLTIQLEEDQKLVDALVAGQEINSDQQKKSLPIISFFSAFFSLIFNFIPWLSMYLFIKLKVKDPVFIPSLYFSFSLILIPLFYLLISFTIYVYFDNIVYSLTGLFFMFFTLYFSGKAWDYVLNKR